MFETTRRVPPKRLILALAAVYIVGLSALDVRSGYYLRLFPLQLVPVLAVGWLYGFRASLPFCLLASVGILVNERLAPVNVSVPLYAAFNVLSASGLFFLGAYLTHQLHAALRRQRKSIEDLQRLRAALEERTALLDQAQELAGLGSFHWTSRTAQLECSEEFLRLAGGGPPNGAPDLDWLLSRLEEPARDGFRTMLDSVLDSGAAAERDLAVAGDGEARRVLAVQMRRLRSGEGDVLGTALDVTAKRRVERLREEVEHMVRHDLRGPLGAIINISRLLAENRADEHDAELLDTVAEAGETMMRLINLSMDICRMEQGIFKLQPAPVDTVALVRRVTADLRPYLKVMGGEVRLRLDGREPGQDQALVVPGNETLCYAMLSNLVRNAIEASPPGGVVDIALEPDEHGARIVIWNQGAVPEEIRATFFEKFVTAGKKGGTGLGTYSARLIARAHGGDIAMETSGERGTTVTVRLPFSQEQGLSGRA